MSGVTESRPFAVQLALFGPDAPLSASDVQETPTEAPAERREIDGQLTLFDLDPPALPSDDAHELSATDSKSGFDLAT